jgi:hypothetical protein
MTSDATAGLASTRLVWRIDLGVRGSTEHLLVLREVPNSPGCTNMADISHYVVDLNTDQIVGGS